MGERRAVQQLHTHTQSDCNTQTENSLAVWIYYVKHKDTKCSQFVFLWSFCGDAERHTHTMEMARLYEENCRKLIVPVHCITLPLASFSCIHHISVDDGVGEGDRGVAAPATPKTTKQNRTIESYVLIVISMFYASYKMRRATFRRLTTVFHSPSYTHTESLTELHLPLVGVACA